MEKSIKSSFNNTAAMKISAVFECNSFSSSSADTNQTPSDFIKNVSQSSQYSQLASYLEVQGSFKRNREGKYLVLVEKMRQGKRKFERKKKRCSLCSGEMEVTEELSCKLTDYSLRCCGFFADAFRPFLYTSFINFVLVSSGCS